MDNTILKPTNDLIFKLIFGDLKNIDILESFLKSVLDLPEDEYSHLSIVDPHLNPEEIDGKQGILDVRVHTKNGKIINVEVQVSNIPQMRERIVFYTSKMIVGQINKGEEYKKIKKVISIVITDYKLINENDNYHNRYHLHDKNTGSTFTDVVEVNSLELPKLPNETDETELWNWLQFLRSERKEDFDMLAKKNKEMKKAVGILKELSQDERTRLIYEEREKAERDEKSRLTGAYDEGIEEGIEKGERNQALKTAKISLENDMSIEMISKITGLSVEEIKDIEKEL